MGVALPTEENAEPVVSELLRRTTKPEDHQSDTYRAVYTVRLARAVYVLHCFKKKSTRGAQTPTPDMELIRARLKVAEQMEKES